MQEVANKVSACLWNKAEKLCRSSQYK